MTFGFLLFRDVEELDFVGPWEVIGMWGKRFGGPARRLLVSQTGGVVTCGKGLQVQTDCSFAACPVLDYLLIPGGQGAEREVGNAELLAFVREHAGGCRQVVAVCTGALILQAVGLLAGRRATTHWQFLDRLRSSGDVTVTEDRFVRDGKIWTAAGVSAGIDVALALVADQAGEDVAGHVQLAMEYYPSARRYGQAHVIPEAPGYLKTDGAASSALHVSKV
jgi:transcriptional regulator GlxA family with amidase domain